MAASMKNLAGFSRSFLYRRLCTKQAEEVLKEVKEPKKPLTKRIGLYFKRIYDDYVWATKETVTYMKEKPIKSATLITTTSVVGYFYKYNPTMADYEAHLAQITCDLAEVSDAIRNEEKNRQLQQLVSFQAEKRLRRFTLGVCSFIWYSDYPAHIDLYEAHCKNVKITWKDWTTRIVDIGCHGRWRWSEEYLIDYDINPEEWKHLSIQNNKPAVT